MSFHLRCLKQPSDGGQFPFGGIGMYERFCSQSSQQNPHKYQFLQRTALCRVETSSGAPTRGGGCGKNITSAPLSLLRAVPVWRSLGV